MRPFEAMADSRVFSLDAVRTDGWFERIGEGIGSFQALCEIIGERFFAFSMITGARITAVMVDRRTPDNTLVDFSVGGGSADEPDGDVQRLTLADFRRRLVGALLADELPAAVPTRETDLEGLQLHIGVRYLLLAPLYGYSLRQLASSGSQSELVLLHDGVEERHDLEAFRARIRAHVREELERVASGHRGAIDLGRVAEAESAALAGDDNKVIQLLGSWPAPLAIFLRTPEGQLLPAEPRALIAKALGLLGSACVRLGDVLQGEEVFRLAVQYAQDGMAAADIFRRLGQALFEDGRAGEAIGPLRRSVALGGDLKALWPILGRAYARRNKHVAAFACLRQAMAVGVPEGELADDLREVEGALGPKLTAWRAVLVTGGHASSGTESQAPPSGSVSRASKTPSSSRTSSSPGDKAGTAGRAKSAAASGGREKRQSERPSAVEPAEGEGEPPGEDRARDPQKCADKESEAAQEPVAPTEGAPAEGDSAPLPAPESGSGESQ